MCRQFGQTSSAEVSRRDLRAELLAAEAEAKEKKRKAEGRPSAALAVEDGQASGPEKVDDEANKRRKMLQEALELDKDDDDDEASDGEKEDGSNENGAKEGGRCVAIQVSIL